MKKLQQQITTVANSLASVSKELEKIAKTLSELETATQPVTPKAKPGDPKPDKAIQKKSTTKASAEAKPKSTTVLDTVLDAIKRSRNGITLAKIMAKTGYNTRQVSNACYKLSKRGLVQAKSRGLYIKK